MDLPREFLRSFPVQRSGSDRSQALRKVFPAFRGWVSFVRFLSGTSTTGIRAIAAGVGTALSRVILATAGCVDQYSPPSRGLATSRRVDDRRLEAPATPEVELGIVSSA